MIKRSGSNEGGGDLIIRGFFVFLSFFYQLNAFSAELFMQPVDEAFIAQKSQELLGLLPVQIKGEKVFISPRGSEKGRAQTTQYLKQEYESLGYEAKLDAFNLNGQRGTNVIAHDPSNLSNRFVVLSAHLDSVFSKTENAGANDNVSGLAVMLAVAKLLKNQRLNVGIQFVSFDSEEIFYEGSRHYVKELDPQGLMTNLNLDMVGYPIDDFKIYLDTCNEPNGGVAQLFIDTIIQHKIKLSSHQICYGRSDHKAFWSVNLPAFRLGSTRYSEDDSCFHQTCDTYERLNLSYMLKVSTAIAYTFLNL